MRKIGLFLLSAAAIVMVAAMPVFAQPGAANEAAAGSSAGLKAIAAGVGFAIAVFGGALGHVVWLITQRSRVQIPPPLLISAGQDPFPPGRGSPA